MLNNFLNKRTISFIMLALVLLAVLFVPGKAAWAAVEGDRFAVSNLSNVDWITRYASGLSVNVHSTPDWVGRHSLVARASIVDASHWVGRYTTLSPDWVDRHASNGYSAPAWIELKFTPPGR